jgi:predicted ester cyclase
MELHNATRKAMSEANKELANLWFEEVWNKGRRSAIRELLAPGAEIRDGNDSRIGTEGFYPFFDRMHAAFSDIHFSVQDVLAEGDKVCLRWSCTMRHTGDGLGIRATNGKLQVTGITIVQIANGKFVAVWQNWDKLGLMQQIKDEPMGPTYIASSKPSKG